MSIQIYILSKLLKGNNYPYELKRQLSEPIPFDEFAGLTESKLYYHFESLAKQGLIEVVEIVKEEHRPDKQVFAITSKGRKELPKKIYKLFENTNDINHMVIGLANLELVDHDKVVGILEEKLRNFKEKRNQIVDSTKLLEVSDDKQGLIDFISNYYLSSAKQTNDWLEELIERIQQKKI
jgi:DNA-binding PadR family transcriptional regulator